MATGITREGSLCLRAGALGLLPDWFQVGCECNGTGSPPFIEDFEDNAYMPWCVDCGCFFPSRDRNGMVPVLHSVPTFRDSSEYLFTTSFDTGAIRRLALYIVLVVHGRMLSRAAGIRPRWPGKYRHVG